MGLNLQLAQKARIRTLAQLEANKIKELNIEIKEEFLSQVKGIGEGTKNRLYEKGIKTIEQFLEIPIEEYRKMDLQPLSLIQIEKFLKSHKQDTLENEVRQNQIDSIEGKVEGEVNEDIKDEPIIEVNYK